MSYKFVLNIISFFLLVASSFTVPADNCNDKYLEAKKAFEDKTYLLEAMPFHRINQKKAMIYFEHEIKVAQLNLSRILRSRKEPTFENLILPIVNLQNKVSAPYSYISHLNSVSSSAQKRNLLKYFAKESSELGSQISYSKPLFKKVEKIINSEAFKDLPDLEKSMTLDFYRSFSKSGFGLSSQKQKRLIAIKNRGDDLGRLFNSNIQKDKSSKFAHFEDIGELEGLTDSMLASCKVAASRRNLSGYVIEATDMSAGRYMSYATNSQSRKAIFQAISGTAASGKYSNDKVVREILELRQEYAQILGYKTYGEFSLEENMAKTPEKVMEYLNEIKSKTKMKAQKDRDKYEAYLLSQWGVKKSEMDIWDGSYYGRLYDEKMTQINGEEVRDHLELEHSVEVIFELVENLYGLEFQAVKIPSYNKEVRTYKVVDTKNNKDLGLFYLDLFSNPKKKQGAWCTPFRSQECGVKPHIFNTLNISKAVEGEKTLLSLSNIRTLLHELGHGLHGLFSNVKYSSVSSFSVEFDFIETPSKFMEYFLNQEWFLKKLMIHHKTGRKAPVSLVKNILKTASFEKASDFQGQMRYGYLDQVFHSEKFSQVKSIREFENNLFERSGKALEQNKTYLTYRFGHLFRSFHAGYAAKYYSYQWSDSFAAHAFTIFLKEKFSNEVANRFRKYILSVGSTSDLLKSYIKFTGGVELDADAVFKANGL